MSSLPDAIVITRAGLCAECALPCAFQACAEAHASPCASCPLGYWHAVRQCAVEPSFTPAPPPGPRGLGDAVAIVASPIGQALGLDPARCGCNKRQADLNTAVPFRPDADPGVVI